MSDHMYDYREFWARIVENDDQLDVEKVARELADYKYLLDNVPKVYAHATGGKLSKPFYAPEQVIEVIRDHVGQLVEFAVMDARAQWEIEQEGGGLP